MSQDNIAVFLVERVAKYLTRRLGVRSQLRYIAKGLNSLDGASASSTLFDQINNIDMCPSYSL